MHHSAKVSTFRKAQQLRRRMTDAETLLWEHLKSRKLEGYKFRKQHPISRYILDFYCHSEKLAIEIDGPNHNLKATQVYDSDRTSNLIELGIKTIRFTNEEVLKDVESVKRKIIAEIKKK